jgi:hypothetical protein
MRLSERSVHRTSGGIAHFWEHVTVDVERKGDSRMS